MRNLFIFLILILISACSNTATNAGSTAVPIPTVTLDPCTPENLPETIKSANNLMREFDDASQLASNLATDQLPPVISEMQRIRRAAEDLNPPNCLDQLMEYQLAHMNTVIKTLLGFVSGADAAALNASIAQARREHDLYTLELAKLLSTTPTLQTP